MPVSHMFWSSLHKVKGLFSRCVGSQTLCIHVGMQNVHWKYTAKQGGISRLVILTEDVAKMERSPVTAVAIICSP